MIVLGRRLNECLRIGPARIMVVRLQANFVHLGVDCPRCIPVDREEIALAKEADGYFRISPPTGVFNDGELFQVKDELFWTDGVNPMVNVSAVITWRFPASVAEELRIVRVGPKEDAKR